MQSYKEWVARWLGLDNEFGGTLALLIHNDPHFPDGGDRKAIRERLKQLNAPESAMIAFGGSWKNYLSDISKKPREASLESKLVHEVQKRGGLCWKFTSPGIAGVPDRIVLVPGGKVVFVEMKAPGKRMRPLQIKRAEQIVSMGLPFYCISSKQGIFDFLQEMFGDGI